MHFSRRCDYAIRALVDLAQHAGHGPIPSGEIAARQGIPESLIAQPLSALRLGGFIRSQRGMHGGFELARSADTIRMDEVVEALDGPIAITEFIESPALAHFGAAAQVEMWDDVHRSIKAALAQRSLSDLARAGAVAAGRYSI